MTHKPDAEEVHQALFDIMRRVCPVRLPDLSPDTVIETVPDLDSLYLVETIALLEEHFAVTVDTDAMTEVTTLGDISNLVLRALPSH